MKKVELQLGSNSAGVGRVAIACSHSPIQSKTQSVLKMAEGLEVQQKKKVRFADDVIEPSSNNKEYRSRLYIDRSSSSSCNSRCQLINT
ncbi:hypothetical protein MKW92_011675 [Papaver armeniacum]|nr:hypothetical protein MKW92_011675 [Papaver armeniacum]